MALEKGEAIRAIGYTDDGKIGILLIMRLTKKEAKQLYQQAKQNGDGISFETNLSMDPDYCLDLSEKLKLTAIEAREKAQ